MVLNNTKDVTKEVIEAIELTNMCQSFGVLPREGGILDQDHLTVRKMQIVLDAQNEKRERKK